MHDDGNKNQSSGAIGEESGVPAMAIGALDSDDAPATDAELQGSPAARDELHAIEEVVGSLGLAVQRAEPPDALRAKILDATTPARAPVSLDQERARRTRARERIAAIAAALLILALGAVAYNQWSTAIDRSDQIDTLQAEIALQDERIAQLERAATSTGAFVNFEQPLIWTELAVTTESGAPAGYLARTPDGAVAYLLLTGVEVDASHVFQAWLIEDTPIPVGTLRPSDEGLGFLILEHDGNPIQDFSLIGVTVEPPGGSPQPTSDPVIVGEIV